MPKKKNQRRPYRGPLTQRDARLRPPPNVGPRGGIGAGSAFEASLNGLQPDISIGGPTPRTVNLTRMGAKWGLGGAVGLGATKIIHDRRKVKKMDLVSKAGRGGAGLPDRVMGFSTPSIGQTREVGALVPTGRNVGRGLDVDHFVNRNASPRQLGVQRFKGKTKNPRSAVEQYGVRKNADLPFKGSGGTGSKVVRLQARTPKGKYVGTANDVQVFHPKFKSKNRMPRTSKLQHYKKTNLDQYAAGFSKSLFGGGEEVNFALTGSIDMSAFARQQGRAGRRF